MKTKLLLLTLSIFIFGCSSKQNLTIAERRANVDQMRDTTISEFYAQIPGGRDIIDNSAGYGVFSNLNVNVIFISGGGGYGVITDNKTGKKTYMNMGEAGIGLGLGVKDFRAVIVFHDTDTLNTFIDSGWEFKGRADAAAKASDKGGAAEAAGTMNKGMSLYEFTESGIVLQATLSGTKYWKSSELN